jgi:hypothetical protein
MAEMLHFDDMFKYVVLLFRSTLFLDKNID